LSGKAVGIPPFSGSIPAASTSQPVALQRVASSQDFMAAAWQRTDCRNCPFVAAPDGELPPHLRYIAERWDRLPPHVREAIFTLIDASLAAFSFKDVCDESLKTVVGTDR